MLYVGIDVASVKHDCCIIDSDGVILNDNFTFANTREGFNFLFDTIVSFLPNKKVLDVRIGLESTGHYSTNLCSFLLSNNLNITVFNPLQITLYRKAQSLRITKTDKSDARFLAVMLFSDNSKSYTPISYQITELQSFVRHRFRLISLRLKLNFQFQGLLQSFSQNCRLLFGRFIKFQAMLCFSSMQLLALLQNVT